MNIVVAPDIENLKQVAAVTAEVNRRVQTGESFLSSQPSQRRRLLKRDLKSMKRAAGRTRDLAGLEDLDTASE